MLKLFNVDDGETHKIAAHSKADARGWATTLHGMDDEDIESVDVVPNDRTLTIHLTDGPDDGNWPSTPFQDARGAWFCTALVSEWLSLAADGDMVCSSV